MQLLASLVPPHPVGQTAVPATDENVVDQSTCQSETGAPQGTGQSQSATETNSTTQIVAFTPATIASLVAAFGISPAPAAGAVNRSQQVIWQIQVGCLVQCSGTTESEQAQQSNSTTELTVAQSGAPTDPVADAVDVVNQVIWQLQIGCLFSCYDATEDQTATSTNTLVAIVATPTPSPTTPDPTSTTAVSSEQPTAAPPAGTGATSSGPVSAPDTGTTALRLTPTAGLARPRLARVRGRRSQPAGPSLVCGRRLPDPARSAATPATWLVEVVTTSPTKPPPIASAGLSASIKRVAQRDRRHVGSERSAPSPLREPSALVEASRTPRRARSPLPRFCCW